MLWLLKPDGIPEWILTYLLHQSRSLWIEENVASDAEKVFIMSNSVIVKPACPDAIRGLANAIDRTSRHAFDSTNDHRQLILLPNLKQPMPMIRHQHPTKET